MKSDKLALIEVKILNSMFLVIYIPVVPTGYMLQGLEYYFPENFRLNLMYYESETFSNSSLHHIFESENFFLWKIA